MQSLCLYNCATNEKLWLYNNSINMNRMIQSTGKELQTLESPSHSTRHVRTTVNRTDHVTDYSTATSLFPSCSFYINNTQCLSMTSIRRILVKTHHMTSRKKILTLTVAAKNLKCSVLLKTGPRPPGIMLAEGEHADDWLKVVKASKHHYPTLFYKAGLTKVVETTIQRFRFAWKRRG
jgi:hypothetical protein